MEKSLDDLLDDIEVFSGDVVKSRQSAPVVVEEAPIEAADDALLALLHDDNTRSGPLYDRLAALSLGSKSPSPTPSPPPAAVDAPVASSLPASEAAAAAAALPAPISAGPGAVPVGTVPASAAPLSTVPASAASLSLTPEESVDSLFDSLQVDDSVRSVSYRSSVAAPIAPRTGYSADSVRSASVGLSPSLLALMGNLTAKSESFSGTTGTFFFFFFFFF